MYIISEIQTTGETTAVLTTTYKDKTSADSNFYSKCASAVLSKVPIHTVKMYNEMGVDIPEMTKTFIHNT